MSIVNTDKFSYALQLLKTAFWSYRSKFLLMLGLGLAAGIFGGVGIGAIIPLFSFLTGSSSFGNDFISQFIKSGFDLVGIKFSLRYLLVLIFFLFLARAVVLLLNNYIKIKITTNYSARLRKQLFTKMTNADWGHLLKQKLGHLDTLLITNVRYSESLFQCLSQSVTVISGLTMYVLVALNISVPITILTSVLGFFIFILFKPLLDRTRMLSNKLENLNREIAHFINEHVTGMKTVKATLSEEKVVKRGSDLFDAQKRYTIRALLYGILPDSLLQPIGLMYVLVIFAFAYKTPNFSLAALAAVVYLIEKMFIYIQQLQKLMQSINEYIPYLESVIRYENEAVESREISEGVSQVSFKDSIEFKNVKFSYDGGKNIFNNLNLKIKQGEMVGIIGPSGVGKTTIVDLILRFFKPTSGTITIDGQNIADIKLKKWRTEIGYISQDIFLLNDSIANNIKFYNEEVSDQDIESAAKMANIFDFVNSTSNKFQTVIGERGIMLSGGQRQRIIIARVLAGHPRILILDEATSSLDNESEREIQNVIDNLKGTITVIIIAHRLSTVKNVDKLVVLGDGEVQEEGSPEELLSDGDSYFKKLYEI